MSPTSISNNLVSPLPGSDQNVLAIKTDGLWVQNGQELVKDYTQSVLKPQIDTYINKEADRIGKISEASETEAGLVRIATEEEVNQLNGEVHAVLTPQKARSVFLEKERFDQFEHEMENSLAEKGSLSELEALRLRVAEMNDTLDKICQALDIINGEVI